MWMLYSLRTYFGWFYICRSCNRFYYHDVVKIENYFNSSFNILINILYYIYIYICIIII